MKTSLSELNAVAIPEVVRKEWSEENSTWAVYYYQEFSAQIFPENKLNSKINSLIQFVMKKNWGEGLRREVVIDLFPFLCAVRPEERAVYIGTRRLSRELTILKLTEKQSLVINANFERKINLLKEHVEKMSTLNVQQFPTDVEFYTSQNNLPDLLDQKSWAQVDELSAQKYKTLSQYVSSYKSTPFEKFSDWGLSLTAQYSLIRIHLLKFLALLPSLDHDKGEEVKRCLLESMRRLFADQEEIKNKGKLTSERPLPTYLWWGMKLGIEVAKILPAPLLASIVRSLVKKMAKRFIAGESIMTSHETLASLAKTKREATLDQLGELVVSAKEADEYFEKVLQLIHGMKHHYSRGEKNAAGILKAHVSIKVSALSHDFKPQAFVATYQKVSSRLRRILIEAQREQVFVNIDAEHYHYRDLVFEIYQKVLLETSELNDYAQTGIVVQAYLRDGAKHLKDVINLARRRSHRMPIRLVKGAYWDAETIEATAYQFESPQFLNKEESDIHFRQLAAMVLENGEYLQLAMASHNLADHCFIEALRDTHYKNSPVIEHQCLHMTYEALSHALAKMNWPTRNYMPIGNLLVGMAYLVRRIMENSSQVGILSQMRSHKNKVSLKTPSQVHIEKKTKGLISRENYVVKMSSDFAPVRPLRFFIQEEKAAFMWALSTFKKDLDKKQDELKALTGEKVVSSSHPDLVVGVIEETNKEVVGPMIEAMEESLKESPWAKSALVLYRVSAMLKAADLMLLRRNDLSALIVYEAGKTWTEALGDVDEAIDFINFYAREEVRLHEKHTSLHARGVVSVIAPWNFPLAIPCGMAVAPLVAGNAVILKPAEQTPLIAKALVELLYEAGVPKEVLKLVLGDGEKVGFDLVNHEKVSGIVFTGSKKVGQWIYSQAAGKVGHNFQTGLPVSKKVITEMGGKNAIIITQNCEMDETVSGVIASAFGHAGQKCSAASRVLVHRQVKDAFISRLISAVKDLQVGAADEASTFVNPLISAQDQNRVREIVKNASDEAIRFGGRILVDRSFEKLPGYCVGPAVFEIPLTRAKNPESWSQREIFGPVLHVIAYDHLMEAIEIFNSTEYALTGGIFSQSQDDIDFTLKFIKSGNIYVNRGITGARVAIEPFGGFKMSGTGPKAGTPEYLRSFHYFPVEETKNLSFEWASGSGFKVFNPKASLISGPGRLKRFEQFITPFMDQFEMITGTVSENDKNKLKNMAKWLDGNLLKYLQGHHDNFKIPGQLSYDDKSMIKESGLFIVKDERPSVQTIINFVTALSIGSGIAVACVTEKSYKTWKSILDLVWKAGFSKINADVYLMGKHELRTLLHDSHFDFIYFGGFSDEYLDVMKNAVDEHTFKAGMRHIYSDLEGADISSPELIVDQYIWVRSLAINTMRHGAPLELN